jgi:hypothetical protein
VQLSVAKRGVQLTTLENGHTAACEHVVPPSSASYQEHAASVDDPPTPSQLFEMRSKRATAQDLLKAWDLDHEPLADQA